jgi:hypothetical protein
MEGDKWKGKAVAEPKKKKSRQQMEWDRVLAMPDTQGQPQRGIRISEGTQSQGEQPQSEQQTQQQQQQQPRRSGRGHQTIEQTESPPSLARSGPWTQGGHTQSQPTPRQRRAAAEELTERERAAGTRPPDPRGPQAEAFGVYLRDLCHLLGPKIRRLRSVPEDQWFPRGREDCDPRFWTILQESFYASYTQHRML